MSEGWKSEVRMERTRVMALGFVIGLLAMSRGGTGMQVVQESTNSLAIVKNWASRPGSWHASVHKSRRASNSEEMQVLSGSVTFTEKGCVGFQLRLDPDFHEGHRKRKEPPTVTKPIEVEFYKKDHACLARSESNEWKPFKTEDCLPEIKNEPGSMQISGMPSKLLDVMEGDEISRFGKAILVLETRNLVDPRRLLDPKGEDDVTAFGLNGKFQSINVAIPAARLAGISQPVKATAGVLELTVEDRGEVKSFVLRLHLEGNEAKEDAPDYWDNSILFDEIKWTKEPDLPAEVEKTFASKQPEKK